VVGRNAASDIGSGLIARTDANFSRSAIALSSTGTRSAAAGLAMVNRISSKPAAVAASSDDSGCSSLSTGTSAIDDRPASRSFWSRCLSECPSARPCRSVMEKPERTRSPATAFAARTAVSATSRDGGVPVNRTSRAAGGTASARGLS
jgi:hypothetical protein